MLGQSEVLTARADADHLAPRPRSEQGRVKPESATSRGVTIRRAVLSEANVIAAILEAAFKHYRKRFTPAAYRVVIVSAEEVSGRIGDNHVWIATDGDLPVGTISIVSTVQGFEVRSLGVLPTAQGRGVGRSLIRTIEAFAQAKGVRLLPIFTMPFLRAAVRLYEHCGYAQVAGCPTDLFRTPLISME